MISVRRARAGDVLGIGAVHVAAWRSAYPGILPAAYLAGLSVSRQAMMYDAALRSGVPIHVATASGVDALDSRSPRVVGFATAGRARGGAFGRRLGEGEIETLYVLDDWRDRGIGRRLLRAAAAQLADSGCRSAFLWVLRDNPSRWFYARLGGRPVAEATIRVGGAPVIQTAFAWDPIDRLLEATARAS
jgi:GNAT superfamily N-acetyltransferase